VHSTPPTNTPEITSTRRHLLTAGAGAAVAAALPIAAAVPAAAAGTLDAELIELGARFEPLVDQYYAVHAIWARAMTRSHSEHDRKFGEPRDRDYQDTPEIRAGWEEPASAMDLMTRARGNRRFGRR
jgi:hypothetical protein